MVSRPKHLPKAPASLERRERLSPLPAASRGNVATLSSARQVRRPARARRSPAIASSHPLAVVGIATPAPKRRSRSLPRRRRARRLSARQARWMSLGVLGLCSAAGLALGGLRSWNSRSIFVNASTSSYATRGILHQNYEAKLARAEAELLAGKLIPPSEKQGAIAYAIQPGDTLQRLSQMFQVDTAAIAVSNGIDAKTKLSVNQKVYIPAAKSIVRTVGKGESLQSIAAEYRVDPIEIARATPLDDPSQVSEGQTLVIPGTAARLLHESSLSREGYETFPPDQPGIEGVGSLKIPPALPATGFIWPVSGDFSSSYGWRWGRMHRGIDIAGPVGSPIGAVKDGVVAFADWDGGFGNKVEIQHSD
ncbi:MAG: M23 family metallopeptidase, partial [Cyanobacteria bacterium J06648_11]